MVDNSLDIRCIVAVVERGKAENVVKAAKKAGATGATVFYARGMGEKEAKKFLDMHIESSKEIIMILSEASKKDNIIAAMTEAGKLNDPGTGIIFSVQIDDLIGLHHRKNLNYEN
ncbi:MAG: P-II family nitrogen regulator [Peptococcia bacterium]